MDEFCSKFIAQYDICIVDGKPLNCGRDNCIKLIEIANSIRELYHTVPDNVSYGDVTTGVMNVEELAKLYNLANFHMGSTKDRSTCKVEVIRD